MAKLLVLTLLVACNAELILDGGDNGWSQWYRSVDGVMGGRSSISVQRDGNVLEASGEIVTAGGGFAGMYTRLDDVDASNFAGLRVTYEALPAGQTPLAWEVRLKGRGDSSRYIDFGASFAVPPSSNNNGVGSASLPFEEFLPRWRGNDRTGTLDLTALNEVGLQLLFQDGPFTLRLRKISLVESIVPPTDPAPGMDATPSAVRDAIDASTRRADYLGRAGARVPNGHRHRVLALGAWRPRGPLGLQGRGGGAKRGNGGTAPSCLRGHRSVRFSLSCPHLVKIMFTSVLHAASCLCCSSELRLLVVA